MDKTTTKTKRPPALKARYSNLTGAYLTKYARERGLTKLQMARSIGASQGSVAEHFSGKYDGKLPVAYDLAIELATLVHGFWDRDYGTRAWHPNRKKRALKDGREHPDAIT
jgi:DNA-binding XRE family transcriptional regulator